MNVGGRGGGGRKSTAPSGLPRPTPLQQATQFIQSLPPRPVEPIVSPAQVLQRLLDPINARLDAIMRSGIRQPDIFVAPNVSINQRFPDINIQPFPNMEEHRNHNRQHVADLPDEPLVRPNAPLVLAGPMRMDDPHEDVPLNEVDPALVQPKKEEEEEEAEAPFGRGSAEIEPRVGGESFDDEKYRNEMDILTRYADRRTRDTLSAKEAREKAQQLGTTIPSKAGKKKLTAQEVKDALGAIIAKERERLNL